jgi:hypothetical protein
MTTQQEKNRLAYQHRQRIESALNPHPRFFFHRRKLLKTLHTSTLPTLAAHGFDGNAYPIPEKFIRECMRLNSFAYFNDLADYLTDREDETLPHSYKHPTGKWALITYFKGLVAERDGQRPNGLRFRHYSQASPEERAIQRAIINATMTINRTHLDRHTDDYSIAVTRLASTDLLRYIAVNPEKSEEIVALINEGRAGTTEESLKSIDDFITTRKQITAPLLDGAL